MPCTHLRELIAFVIVSLIRLMLLRLRDSILITLVDGGIEPDAAVRSDKDGSKSFVQPSGFE